MQLSMWILCFAFLVLATAEASADNDGTDQSDGADTMPTGPPIIRGSGGEKKMLKPSANKDMKKEPSVEDRSLTGSHQGRARSSSGCENRCGTYDSQRNCSCSHFCVSRDRCCSDFKDHCDFNRCTRASHCKKKYSMCMKEMCRCMPGYLRQRDGSCKAVNAAAMNKCTSEKTAQCKKKNSMCMNGICRCMPGHMRLKDGSCQEGKRSSSGCQNRCGTYDRQRNCSCSHFCLTQGRCCSDFKEHCDFNGCTSNDQCKGKHSMCRRGMCRCMPGHLRHGDGSCKAVKIATMKKCESNTQCKGNNSMCVKGMCRCMPGHSHQGDGSCKEHSPGCDGRCGTFDHQRNCSCSHFCLARDRCCSDFREHCMHFVDRFFSNRE